MMKMMSRYPGPLISSLWKILLTRFAVGRASCHHSFNPSRRKTAPTVRSPAAVMVLGMFLFAAFTAVAAEDPAPEIALSLQGIGDDTVEQGEPIRITIRLTAPRDAVGVIELAPASGVWSDALTVELAPAGGGAAGVRAEVVGKPAAAAASLSATRFAGGMWRISSTAMQRVQPGNYVVRARLALKSGTGWKGETDSDEIPLQVVAKSDSAYRVTQRTINQAHEALMEGRIEAAVGIVDAVLQVNPNDARLLIVRAALADRAGNPVAALLCLKRASRVNPPSGVGPPPVESEELETRISAILEGGKKKPATPPAWSWPPAAVLAMSDEELLALSKALLSAQTEFAAPSSPTPVAPVFTQTVSPTAPVPPPRAEAAPDLPVATISSAAGGGLVPAGALIDATIIADPKGQWAVGATAGTQYGKTQYSPAQATGAPNISVAGNSPAAWCPESKSVGTDWLEVSFSKPVYATEVRVRQNDAAGAIVQVEVIEPNGTAHVWWEGADPYGAAAKREIVWFAVRVPKTNYLVAKVKITLNLAAVPGWKEIDAVQLVGAGQ